MRELLIPAGGVPASEHTYFYHNRNIFSSYAHSYAHCVNWLYGLRIQTLPLICVISVKIYVIMYRIEVPIHQVTGKGRAQNDRIINIEVSNNYYKMRLVWKAIKTRLRKIRERDISRNLS
jgi:hypothetical protein